MRFYEFVHLAKTIEVPKNVLSSLKSLIGKRRKCNTWFSGQADDETHQQQNQSHDHAISIFEQVLRLLASKSPVTKPSTTSASSTGEDDPVNAFAALHLEDAFSDDEGDPEVSYRKSPSQPLPDEHPPGPCPGCIQADLAFECYCFYGDLWKYRQYLQLL